MKIANELFSWFKHQFICPDVWAFKATIFVYSTPNSIISKGYCAGRSQMTFLSRFKNKFICSDVRALTATIFVHSTPNSVIGKGYCSWRSKMSFFSRFKHEFIFPYVRALNATIFVHSTLNSIIGKKYCVWRLQMSYLADLSTSLYILMLERWMLLFSYIQRPKVWLVWNIVSEAQKLGF